MEHRPVNNRPLVFIGSLLIIALVVIVAFLIQTNPFGDVAPPHRHEAPQQPQEQPSGMEFGDVMTLYGQACASCHGKFGEGVAGFPSIQNSSLELDEIKTIIREGKGNMPAFNHIEEPMLTRLAEFTKKL
jgi:mono/diheme cytochrome c family protein